MIGDTKIINPFSALLAVIIFFLTVVPLSAQQSSPLGAAEESAIRSLILKTIRENPKAIVDAILSYQE